MPAWITPLLCVLVSRPGRGCRSITHVEYPRREIASAEARPVTPAPMIATSIRSIVTCARASIPDDCVVEMAEQQIVQNRRVRVRHPGRIDTCLRDGIGRCRDACRDLHVL